MVFDFSYGMRTASYVPADKEADVVDAFRETLISKNAFSSGEVGLPYIIQTARKW